MATDVDSGSYEEPSLSSAGGLKRHYAQRIKNLGHSRRETWISRLWNHISKNRDEYHYESEMGQVNETTADAVNNHSDTRLPPINKDGSLVHSPMKQTVKEGSPRVQFSEHGATVAPHPPPSLGPREHNVNPQLLDPRTKSAPSSSQSHQRPGSQERSRPLPPSLANSPYIPVRDRNAYKLVTPEKNGTRSQTNPNHSEQYSKQQRREVNMYMARKKTHPYLSTHTDSWRPKLTRRVSVINLEKRAKEVAEKAMKVSITILGTQLGSCALTRYCIHGLDDCNT